MPQLRITAFATDYNTGEPTTEIVRDTVVKAEGGFFVTDDCHKIYLAIDQSDVDQLKECGWDESDFRPFSELPEVWETTCPLRFISRGDLTTQYVEQCEYGVVTYG